MCVCVFDPVWRRAVPCREFWKESVPRLSVPPPAAPAEQLSAFEERRHRLLLQPISRLLLGDDAVDGEVRRGKTGEMGERRVR